MNNIRRRRSNVGSECENIFGDETIFIPQCNFLVYGNNGVDKTLFCYYLTYMFKENADFDDKDIIYGMNDEKRIDVI